MQLVLIPMAIFMVEHVEVEPNQQQTLTEPLLYQTKPLEVKLESVVAKDSPPPLRVGGLVGLPHLRGQPASIHCFKSVKNVLNKFDLNKDLYYLDDCIEMFPLEFGSARILLKVFPKYDST